jgi:hypothetical protein
MCLLTYIPEGIQPNVEALREGCRTNRDGFGFAIVLPSQRKIIVEKSMDREKLLTKFTQMRAKHPEGPALFHSRLATDGTTSVLNVHPFHVNGDSRTVLGHNGIFSQARPELTDWRSDTRIVADSFAAKFNLRSRKGRRRFGSWMGRFNKVVILTVDPAYDRHGYIINESEGIWDKGVWYSNSSYVPWTPRVGGGYTWYPTSRRGKYGTWFKDERGVWKWKPADDRRESAYLDCPVCVAPFTVSPVTYRCVKCRSCQACYESEEDCRCWLDDSNPERVRGSRTLTEAEIDTLMDDWDRENATAGKELMPLGTTVASALEQARQWARENHAMSCACEWCLWSAAGADDVASMTD